MISAYFEEKPMSEATSTLTIRTLLCHRDVDMALACLGSLLKFSFEPLHLVIHDDGSLTPEDAARLLSELEGSTILFRAEADELMNQRLKHYPNSYKFRFDTVMGLKLLDTAILSQGDIAYCDSDILFFRPFQGMFHLPDMKTSAIFIKDCREAYSVLPWQLLGSKGLKLPSRVNAGLMFVRKKAYDLDFIEWLLGQAEFRSDPLHRLEQTSWAALGYRIGCQLWNPQQVALVESRKNITDQLIAGHFVSRYRYLLREFLPKANLATQESFPVIVETIPSKDCNLLALSHSLLRHKLGPVKNAVLKRVWRNYKAPWKHSL